MNSCIPAAFPSINAPSVTNMAGAGSHHQPGTTSMVQQSQVYRRAVLMAVTKLRRPLVSNMPKSQPQQSTKEEKIIPIVHPDTEECVVSRTISDTHKDLDDNVVPHDVEKDQPKNQKQTDDREMNFPIFQVLPSAMTSSDYTKATPSASATVISEDLKPLFELMQQQITSTNELRNAMNNIAVTVNERFDLLESRVKKLEDQCVAPKNEETIFYEKVEGIFEKLTPKKFYTLAKKLIKLGIDTEKKLNGVVNLLFEKAINEPNFSVLWANVCNRLSMLKVSTDEEGKQLGFRKLLLTKCQKEFEQYPNEELRRTERLQQIESCENNDQRKQLQEELDDKERKNKRRQLGNIRFIGELFKLGILVEPIMHDCITKLLMQKDEDSLECLCRLLMTIGKELETLSERGSESAVWEKKELMNFNFNEMQKIVDKRWTTSRVRFMLQDVIDLRKRNWIPMRENRCKLPNSSGSSSGYGWMDNVQK